jgi:Mn2+/Fe2+ NRAMP family transporter
MTTERDPVIEPSPLSPVRERSQSSVPGRGRRVVRALGLGLITGAADDDPSAIGTYASAGASIGPAFLWTAPVTFPMMVGVVYLSSKLGLVSGQGLFAVIRAHYSRWFLYTVLAAVLVGNTIEAGADIGGMSAALNLLIPIPIGAIVPITGVAILVLQIWGSYEIIRNIFRFLALALLAYVGSAILAHPEASAVITGTFIPSIRFNKDFLAMLVA